VSNFWLGSVHKSIVLHEQNEFHLTLDCSASQAQFKKRQILWKLSPFGCPLHGSWADNPWQRFTEVLPGLFPFNICQKIWVKRSKTNFMSYFITPKQKCPWPSNFDGEYIYIYFFTLIQIVTYVYIFSLDVETVYPTATAFKECRQHGGTRAYHLGYWGQQAQQPASSGCSCWHRPRVEYHWQG